MGERDKKVGLVSVKGKAIEIRITKRLQPQKHICMPTNLASNLQTNDRVGTLSSWAYILFQKPSMVKIGYDKIFIITGAIA